MQESKTLLTWAGNALFTYEGDVTEGTTIRTYGSVRVFVSASDYEALLERFRGCTVDLGVSFTPPGGSIGHWLVSHVTKTKIAFQVRAILVAEGYAERVGRFGIRIL